MLALKSRRCTMNVGVDYIEKLKNLERNKFLEIADVANK